MFRDVYFTKPRDEIFLSSFFCFLCLPELIDGLSHFSVDVTTIGSASKSVKNMGMALEGVAFGESFTCFQSLNDVNQTSLKNREEEESGGEYSQGLWGKKEKRKERQRKADVVYVEEK